MVVHLKLVFVLIILKYKLPCEFCCCCFTMRLSNLRIKCNCFDRSGSPQLICVFVFAYANCWFSHAGAHMSEVKRHGQRNCTVEEWTVNSIMIVTSFTNDDYYKTPCCFSARIQL